MILRQLENDSDRDVRASTNVFTNNDDSCLDESLETNRTNYLDETIECEPSVAGGVPEVVVVGEDGEQDDQNETNEETSQQLAVTKQDESLP